MQETKEPKPGWVDRAVIAVAFLMLPVIAYDTYHLFWRLFG